MHRRAQVARWRFHVKPEDRRQPHRFRDSGSPTPRWSTLLARQQPLVYGTLWPKATSTGRLASSLASGRSNTPRIEVHRQEFAFRPRDARPLRRPGRRDDGPSGGGPGAPTPAIESRCPPLQAAVRAHNAAPHPRGRRSAARSPLGRPVAARPPGRRSAARSPLGRVVAARPPPGRPDGLCPRSDARMANRAGDRTGASVRPTAVGRNSPSRPRPARKEYASIAEVP